MLVHGVEIPEDRELLLYVEEIKNVKKEIESFFDSITGDENSGQKF